MEYAIVSGPHDELSDLVDRVNELISKGWTPLGGISSNEICMQAMVRR